MKRFILVMALFACQKASEERREMPKLPPPPQAKVPPSLHIDVEVDGRPQPQLAIDAGRLAKAAPDFTDGEHKAWRFSTILGLPIAPGTAIAVTGAQNVTVTLKQPQSAKDPQPVLTESRRGEIVAALISPEDPFPAFHGQGRRLARPMDPLPRIAGVTKISVHK